MPSAAMTIGTDAVRTARGSRRARRRCGADRGGRARARRHPPSRPARSPRRSSRGRSRRPADARARGTARRGSGRRRRPWRASASSLTPSCRGVVRDVGERGCARTRRGSRRCGPPCGPRRTRVTSKPSTVELGPGSIGVERPGPLEPLGRDRERGRGHETGRAGRGPDRPPSAGTTQVHRARRGGRRPRRTGCPGRGPSAGGSGGWTRRKACAVEQRREGADAGAGVEHQDGLGDGVGGDDDAGGVAAVADELGPGSRRRAAHPEEGTRTVLLGPRRWIRRARRS